MTLSCLSRVIWTLDNDNEVISWFTIHICIYTMYMHNKLIQIDQITPLQDDGGTVEFEANGSRRLRELAGTGAICFEVQ